MKLFLLLVSLIIFIIFVILILIIQYYYQESILLTSTSSVSDIRLKENIINISDDDINKLSQLNPKSYNFINQENVERYGFIAQEVQNIYPNLVVTSKNGVLSINYDDIIALIIAKLNKQTGPCVEDECLNKDDMVNIKNMQKLSNYGNTSGESINSSTLMKY